MAKSTKSTEKSTKPFRLVYSSGPSVIVIDFKSKESGMKWDAEVHAIKAFIANINTSAEQEIITVSQKKHLYRQWVDHVLGFRKRYGDCLVPKDIQEAVNSVEAGCHWEKTNWNCI